MDIDEETVVLLDEAIAALMNSDPALRRRRLAGHRVQRRRLASRRGARRLRADSTAASPFRSHPGKGRRAAPLILDVRQNGQARR
jgi:hypothetical protein